ncbi:peroxisomal sarcosine oxidase-like [Ostrea edulis]|uniref:peroxisomal sarcosine oxidase-like n=1 Tax=Ostrea edulis TaxID=37623 RepID=UPI0024AEB48B|nr:peroxisomal sarcosine oxidase-like [Ostrea edulis]XP_048738575.2 peroxisomal sarcosine oxidase-like [Ostrea edulis]XP_048738576.2 peroxisomal sarcosine oxidase-like [Ostrea edulis]XP_048738577.2 peroxisomal sarcosine oxidase-like [Ostrea edulis]XP_048738578.2 peroxisomal sarcosine oxidase-like [Ostrea edulis]
MDFYDVIVVGAGIEGSSTAYQLAKQGKKTLLLEQFPLPHSRGSSHGQSRITRKAYGEMEHYTVMMKEAYKLWETLEQESGRKIFQETGMLTMGSADDKFTMGTIRCLQCHGIPHQTMDYNQMKRAYPMIEFPRDFTFVIDKSGGILRADKALMSYHETFRHYGGIIKDGEKVLEIIPGDSVVIITSTNQYRAQSVVLAVGAWATKLLPKLQVHLPIKVLRINVLYWKEKVSGQYGVDKFPVFLQENAISGFTVYGLPSAEYPGLVKICLHWGPEVDPDTRDKADDTWVINTMKKYVSKHFPELNPEPAIIETCMYTWSDDENLILDHHPSWRNIVIGAGFSGHGFKLASVVGKVLAELATNETPSYDMTPFRIQRFRHNAKL